jgi:CheY-like chemotaxis protein
VSSPQDWHGFWWAAALSNKYILTLKFHMNPISSPEKLTIFLAEDDQDDVFLFSNALHTLEKRHDLQVFGDGQELTKGLEAVSTTLPDIIFIDINMPVKNGLEALRDIRQKYPVRLPVFLFSTTEDRVTVEQARRLGATGYLSKPKLQGDLERLLKQVLSIDWYSRSIHDFYVHLQVIDIQKAW